MLRRVSEIDGYSDVRDIYFVNDRGVIYSYGNYGSEKRAKHPKKLSPNYKPNGYVYYVLMCVSGKTRDVRSHRLVAAAFVNNPNKGMYDVVHHLDNNKSNNHYLNLEWTDISGNTSYALAKHIFQYDFNGDLIKVFGSAKEASHKGFNQGHIGAVARGVEPYHKGFHFSFEYLSKEEVVQRLSKPFPKRKRE